MLSGISSVFSCLLANLSNNSSSSKGHASNLARFCGTGELRGPEHASRVMLGLESLKPLPAVGNGLPWGERQAWIVLRSQGFDDDI